jgi:putative transposase
LKCSKENPESRCRFSQQHLKTSIVPRNRVERLIGSIRRECLDHLIVLHEHHLRQRLTGYFHYYHQHRTHRLLDQDAPESRAVEPPDQGNIIALPWLGGLHHRYTRQAAA